MDEIQRVLVKVGRKDLAQKYYRKVAATELELDDIVRNVVKKYDLRMLWVYKVAPNKKTGKIHKIQFSKKRMQKNNSEWLKKIISDLEKHPRIKKVKGDTYPITIYYNE